MLYTMVVFTHVQELTCDPETTAPNTFSNSNASEGAISLILCSKYSTNIIENK